MTESFRIFAQRASEAAGSPWAFLTALSGVGVWLALGPVFGFTDTWQLTSISKPSMSDSELEFLEQEFERVRATRQRVGVVEVQAAETTRSTSTP